MEFSGGDATERANVMAASFRSALGDSAVVSRSVRLAVFRLRGLDLMVDQVDVRRAVASNGGCLEADVSVGEIGRLSGGTRSVWVKCPVDVARGLCAGGRLAIGWSSAIAEFFKVQRIQCYRCWGFGHVRESVIMWKTGLACASDVDNLVIALKTVRTHCGACCVTQTNGILRIKWDRCYVKVRICLS